MKVNTFSLQITKNDDGLNTNVFINMYCNFYSAIIKTVFKYCHCNQDKPQVYELICLFRWGKTHTIVVKLKNILKKPSNLWNFMNCERQNTEQNYLTSSMLEKYLQVQGTVKYDAHQSSVLPLANIRIWNRQHIKMKAVFRNVIWNDHFGWYLITEVTMM